MPQVADRTCDVVACVVTDGDRVCLVRRSSRVGHDRGRWHCVTGYIDPGQTALESARAELAEELGLGDGTVELLSPGPVVSLRQSSTLWRVHTFLAHISPRPLRLNWENDAYFWTCPTHSMDGCVPWLAEVYASLLPTRQAVFAQPSTACRLGS